VLHDINLLNSLCSHVLLIREGRVIANGEKDEVLTLDNLERAYSLKFKLLEDAGPYKFAPADFV
jgi:iron complex transport system ATP-binding protein